MRPHEGLCILLCTFIAGIALRTWDPALPRAAILLCTIMPLLMLGFRPEWKSARWICTLIALGITATILAEISVIRSQTWTKAAWKIEKTIELRGFIALPPERRPPTMQYVIAIEDPVGTRVLISDRDGAEPLHYGDGVLVRGTPRIPEPIDGFAYDRYLASRGVTLIIDRPTLTPTGTWKGSRTLRTLANIRSSAYRQIRRLLPEPESSLLIGLLTGSRGSFPQDLDDAFRTTGLTHIIAVSGSNVALVVVFLSAILFWIPIKLRIPLLIAGVGLFALFTGATAAVMRAAIVGSLSLFALFCGRKSDAWISTIVAAALMLAINPLLLWTDPGFQLSFAAIAGLLEVQPVIAPVTQKLPRALGIREAVEMTLAAQLSTFPISALQFGQCSLIAPLSNLLVAPVLPATILSGLIALVLSFVHALPASLVSLASYVGLHWIVKTAEWLAHVPLAALRVPAPRSTALLMTMLLFWLVHCRRRRATETIPSDTPAASALPPATARVPRGQGSDS